MLRELEPEYMDTDEEADGYDAMDHSGPNETFVNRLVELGAHGRVLDIGTGFRLCIEGCSLEVEALGPAGALREAQARDARPLGSGGIYLDTLLSGQALGVATDPAHPNTLTQSVVVPALLVEDRRPL